MEKNYIYLISTTFLCTFLFLAWSASASTNTTFPVNDSGLAAYVQVDPTCINEAKLINDGYDTVIVRNLTYSTGTVKVNNGVEDVTINVYVGMDGWIVAYFNKTDPTGKLMQWTGYTTGSLTTTTLADAIKKVSADMGCNYSAQNLRYYDFRHPNATNVTIIAEYTKGTNTFSVVLPFSPTAETYEAAYSHYGYNSYSGYNNKYYETYLKIDGKNINTIKLGNGKKAISYGTYNLTTDLTVGESHDISLSSYNGWMKSYAATIIIYRL